MRPTEGSAGRPLGAAGFPQGTNSKPIVAEHVEVGKQAALHLWCIEVAVNLQRADVSLLALGFAGVAS